MGEATWLLPMCYRCLTSRSNSLTNIFQRVVMIQNEKKKCHELDALFTFDRQQDEAASAKIASSSWLLSLSCRSTKVIGISFLIFRVNLREGFSFPVDCRSGVQYPGTGYGRVRQVYSGCPQPIECNSRA